jgi:hypothetical protein
MTRKNNMPLLCGILFLVIVCRGLQGSARRMLPVGDGDIYQIKPYSQDHISRTAPAMVNFHPRLLVFTGERFEVYNLNHKNVPYRLDDPYPRRGFKTIPLLVHALKELQPDRFTPGKPVFQLLFSDSDSISSHCVNADSNCPVDDFSPWLLFGSPPANSSEMPTVKGFPHWFFLSCLYEYKIHGIKQCQWAETVDRTLVWDELRPTLIWRGTDFVFSSFYNEFKFSRARHIDLTNATSKEDMVSALMNQWDHLTPRWRAIALSAEASLRNETWIDNKFVGEEQKKFIDRGVVVVAVKPMSTVEMAKYKYQIDYGGGGGTRFLRFKRYCFHQHLIQFLFCFRNQLAGNHHKTRFSRPAFSSSNSK